jgi:polynucleotide 5'-triphosphatase
VRAVPHPVGSPTHTRRKDRLSYSHEEFNVDLTQVTVSSHPGAPPVRQSMFALNRISASADLSCLLQSAVLHELEIEIARPALLLSLAAKRGDPNVSEHERTAFDELVRAFVNNARILVRNAGGH